MKNKMMMGIAIIFLVIIMSSFSAAMGVMPSSKKFLIGEQMSYQLKIVNDPREDFTAQLSVQGPLSDYIKLSETSIKFTKADDVKRVNVDINIPEGLQIGEGEHTNYIIISQTANNEKGVEALVNLAATLTISKPYSSEALNVKIFTTNFEKNKQNNFVLEIQSLGTKDIPEAIPIVEIYSGTNDKLETLQGERFSIKPGEKILVDIPWTPSYPNGKYIAKAYIIYGEKTSTFEKTFSIGSPEIIIDSITTTAFKLGGIAALDIILSNTWIEQIDDVYANIFLNDDGKTVYSTKTSSKSVSGLSKTNLPAYIDTERIPPGKYDLNIHVHYLGQESNEVFKIVMDAEEFRFIGPTGQVVKKSGESNIQIVVLIVIVLILVIMNGLLFYKFVITKKKEK